METATQRPRLTVVARMRNDAGAVDDLLASLQAAAEAGARVVVEDRGSTDGTAERIAAHPLARSGAIVLHGTAGGRPSRRELVAGLAPGYVTFLTAPDRINPAALTEVARRAGPGHHMILTSSVEDGVFVRSPLPSGPVSVSSASIGRILRDGGVLFDVEALQACQGQIEEGETSDADPVALALLLAGYAQVHHVAAPAFYHPSGEARSPEPFDPADAGRPAARLRELIRLYDLNEGVLLDLRRRLDERARAEPGLSPIGLAAARATIRAEIPLRLKRIVLLTDDSSTIGGIPSRTRKTMHHAQGRAVEYVNIASRKTADRDVPSHLDFSSEPERVLALLDGWSPAETVVFTPNNVLRRFDEEFRLRVERFPIVHVFSGQLAFMVQDQVLLAQLDYVESYRVSSILSFSDMDIAFQRQLGVYGQIKGWLPVDTREVNDYAEHTDRAVGYVGRIDFHAKAADRLLELAELMRAQCGWPPIRVYTTSASNSPHYGQFVAEIERRGLGSMFDITLDCEDKNRIFHGISVLVLPSKKESFGQVVLEAFSYGIPVVAASYAPGPSELIVSGQNGVLVDDFSAGPVLEAIEQVRGGRLAEISANAFATHKRYTMSGHLDLLEEVASKTLSAFLGRNEIRPYPELAIARQIARGRLDPDERASMRQRLELAHAEIEAYRTSRSWKITAPLRWLSTLARG